MFVDIDSESHGHRRWDVLEVDSHGYSRFESLDHVDGLAKYEKVVICSVSGEGVDVLLEVLDGLSVEVVSRSESSSAF